MRKKRNVKVGDLVEFPYYMFAPMRSGWNGWLFRVGIVEKVFTTAKGKAGATVRYCAYVPTARNINSYSAYCDMMKRAVEETANIKMECLFVYDNLASCKEGLETARTLTAEEWADLDNGRIWGGDGESTTEAAILFNHGFLD